MKKVLVSSICGVVLLGAQLVQAQFHQKDKAGKNQLNQGAANSTQQVPATGNKGDKIITGRISKDVGLNTNSTMIMTDAQRTRFRDNNARMGKQENLQIDHWARSIQHADHSYTQTSAKMGMKQIIQETKSENGVLLLKRVISLDARGQPKEILMYDGRDKFKYRGVLLYDKMGRFMEEQLFDANEKPLRRKIQKYDAQGKQLPLQTFDYVANIPKDLRLVITRENEKGRGEQAQALAAIQKEKGKKKLFGSKKAANETGRQGPAPAQLNTAAAPTAQPTQAKKKGSFLKNLRFGKKKGK